MAVALLHELIGSEVVAKDGSKVETRSLCGKGKIIGLFFSAHWCPPCREFTPKLVACYNKLKSTDKPFEIIFVSGDRNTDSYKDYYATMPWYSMVFSEDQPELREETMEKYCLEGIPMLILVDGDTGQMYSKTGRQQVEQDPDGIAFPWRGLVKRTSSVKF